MKDRISALMDGELDDHAAAEACEALKRDREARETWRTYQLISDAMHESRGLSRDFTARVAERLAAEPTVLAPRLRPEPRWYALSAAASLAAVALVGWMAFAPQPQPPAPVAIAEKPVMVPIPTAANDYLLAHQGFSPRLYLQGVAPYVRTVAEHQMEPRTEPRR